MNEINPIYDGHYQDYQTRLAAVDIETISDRLGLLPLSEGQFILPFLEEKFLISRDEGIKCRDGSKPSYLQFVVMARYLLNCPDQRYEDNRWVSFKDFKMVSHFTNVNYFNSDTESALAKSFAGQTGKLEEAGRTLGATPVQEEYPYDISLQFTALPRISLLLLFNDADDDFPASCTVLFPQHAERYLDPEALAVTSAYLARRLRKEL